MRSDPRLLSVLVVFCLLSLSVRVEASEPKETNINRRTMEPLTCENLESVTLSGVYSPYRIHVIKAEVTGTIIKINAREGQMLPAGIPIMEIDCSALEKQLELLKDIVSALTEERKLLEKNLELVRKKYNRYLQLKKAGHIEQQLVEDMEAQVNAALMSMVDNRRQIAATKRSISEIQDRIKKSRPLFDRPLYVSQNFKELYESTVPGEKLSRLLDISKAKIHLVLSISCFKRLQKRLTREKTINFSILDKNGKAIQLKGKAERLKIDTDNHYLYSYGFDLVFSPLENLLWGQVVRVQLHL